MWMMCGCQRHWTAVFKATLVFLDTRMIAVFVKQMRTSECSRERLKMSVSTLTAGLAHNPQDIFHHDSLKCCGH